MQFKPMFAIFTLYGGFLFIALQLEAIIARLFSHPVLMP
jgi:hypothetical protein